MNNKYIRLRSILLFVIAFSICMPAGVMAATSATINAVVDNVDHYVTISGQLAPSRANQRVNLQILKIGQQAKNADGPSAAPVMQVFASLDQTKTDTNGNYIFKESLNTATGRYSARVWIEDMQSPCETTFYFINPFELANTITRINNCTSIDGIDPNDPNNIKNILKDNQHILNLDYTLFNQLKDKTLVYQTLVNDPNYDNIDSLSNAFMTACVLQSLNEEKNDVIYKDLMTNYSSKLQYTGTTAYITYNVNNDPNGLLDPNGQGLVRDALMQKASLTVSDFVKNFSEHTILYAINRVRGIGVVDRILTTNQATIGYDVTTYNNHKDAIQRAISGVLYPSLDSLKSAMIDAAAKDSTSSDTGTDTPKSKGGSTTIGGGGSAMPPYIEPTPTPSKKDFADLGNVEWAVQSIRTLADMGAIAGDSDGNFLPDKNVKREEFIKILTVAFGLVDEAATADFSDIAKDDWCYKYVASAQKAGISRGLPDGTFGVGQDITRQEMAVLAYRAAVYNKKTLDQIETAMLFMDADQIQGYALDSITAMQRAGIIRGTGDGNFSPNSFSTRAQAAKVIYELLTRAHD